MSITDKIPDVSATPLTMKSRIDPEKLLHEFGKYGKYQVAILMNTSNHSENYHN